MFPTRGCKSGLVLLIKSEAAALVFKILKVKFCKEGHCNCGVAICAIRMPAVDLRTKVRLHD